jgi:hypothetical protein
LCLVYKHNARNSRFVYRNASEALP